MERREIEFAQGDRLDADLRIVQVMDEEARVFVNEPNGYEVIKVYEVKRAPKQVPLLEKGD
jgi:hypothetical protein